jgi:hypothetical protein
VLIAVVGWWLAGVIERGTRRALMAAPHMDLTVGTFLSSLARYATLVIADDAVPNGSHFGPLCALLSRPGPTKVSRALSSPAIRGWARPLRGRRSGCPNAVPTEYIDGLAGA